MRNIYLCQHLTFIVVMPSAGEILLDRHWRFISAGQSIDTTQLSPCQRMTEHLTSFLDVELSRLQEPQNVLIFRNLKL